MDLKIYPGALKAASCWCKLLPSISWSQPVIPPCCLSDSWEEDGKMNWLCLNNNLASTKTFVTTPWMLWNNVLIPNTLQTTWWHLYKKISKNWHVHVMRYASYSLLYNNMIRLLTEQVWEPTDFKQLIHSSISFLESALKLIFWNAVITYWQMKQQRQSCYYE